jgi:hypothetical protein
MADRYAEAARDIYDTYPVSFSVVGTHDPALHLTSTGPITEIMVLRGDEQVPIESFYGEDYGPDFDGAELARAMMDLVHFRHTPRIN